MPLAARWTPTCCPHPALTVSSQNCAVLRVTALTSRQPLLPRLAFSFFRYVLGHAWQEAAAVAEGAADSITKVGVSTSVIAARMRMSLDTDGVCVAVAGVLAVSADLRPNVLTDTPAELATTDVNGDQCRLARIEGQPRTVELQQRDGRRREAEQRLHPLVGPPLRARSQRLHRGVVSHECEGSDRLLAATDRLDEGIGTVVVDPIVADDARLGSQRRGGALPCLSGAHGRRDEGDIGHR